MKLVKKEIIEKPDIVYNLEIETDHNYSANGAIVSNCHMCKADVLKKLLTGPFSNCPIRWGLTGTIPKEEFEYLALLLSIGPVINRLSAAELQEMEVLANCHVNICQLQDFGEYATYAQETKYLLTDEDRIKYLSEQITKVGATGNTLVLVQQIKSGELLTHYIPDSVFINGSVKTKDRKDEYDTIKTQDGKIIVATYGVAAVGINIPRIFNLVLIEPGKSFVRVIQSIGRGLRKAQDKDFVQIWDVTSSMKFSKRHLTQRKKFYADAEYDYKVHKINYQTGSNFPESKG